MKTRAPTPPQRQRGRSIASALRPASVLVLLAFSVGAVAAAEANAGHNTGARATIEQRVAPCIACHGRQGSSSNAAYYPRLSGKPEGYLFDQLQSFRDGRRFHRDMVYLVRHMSDENLRDMARYFARLDLPYPAVGTTTDADANVLARGQQLVREGDAARGIPACASCHGDALMGVEPGIPPLLGLPRLYIASQLGAWLTGDRSAPEPDCMSQVGRKLDTADINAVAAWLAIQPVPQESRAAARSAPLPTPCHAMRAQPLATAR
ncbi:c-type cytochrome [Variovorax dokdonensis]|uniref:C-type cytochrome n=1 Tax=Variovorax dokdonensis TaxID=344883 RepID=A0ABT7N7G3_9BURK|nr:c-type cytochrome [Variovorax dokdonensis]MDM0043872.1 c-type cytochrome [Variovorax dokdonensis]